MVDRTESTDLIPIMHRLVGVVAVRVQSDGKELATFQQLIDPRRPIPDDARRAHGITDTMVWRQPIIDHVLPRFLDFLSNPDAILLAHHAGFDLGLLAMALTRRAP
jgi:DNA polymerase III subunit epsilon